MMRSQNGNMAGPRARDISPTTPTATLQTWEKGSSASIEKIIYMLKEAYLILLPVGQSIVQVNLKLTHVLDEVLADSVGNRRDGQESLLEIKVMS